MTNKENIEISKPPLKNLRQMITGLRLFPKTHDFFLYFNQLAVNISAGSRLLCQMIAKKEQRVDLLKELKDCERKGDRITHEIINLVRETFLTPFDRSDMHNLVVRMDDILDSIYHIGNRLTRYDVDAIPDELVALADLVLASSDQVALAVKDLSHPKKFQDVLKHCVEIKSLEKKADITLNAAIELIFNNGSDAFQLIKLKELSEKLEATTDQCKNVANIIEGIILKHA
ncbi:MAG TPA: DUF47 domain-containing protein [Deltaproteobacteria bacterium]|nr:DUF47 domain-containing protein [Deltaproteobacteria bacterium]